MAKQYYLSNNGTHIGPFGFDIILRRLENSENMPTDYIYDESIGDWLMLMEHPEFKEKVQFTLKPTAKVAPLHGADKYQDKEWYILKSGNNYGPFCQLEIVQMLQEKSLYEYDYIWHAKMPAWQRVSEVEDFSSDSIRNMKSSTEAAISEVFFRRRHARASYGASLIVHDNKTVFKGKALEISAGGAGVLIDESNLAPGQSLFLHFQPGDGVPPFNAVCQVVSKHMVKDGTDAGKVRYGVKFTTIPQSVRESIKHYTQAA